MPPRPKNESQQERRLEQAQRQLERIRKQEERARKLVEQEMRRLEALRNGQESILQGSPTVTPDKGAASPATFDSQYDQFGNILSGERLSTEPANITSSDLIPAVNPVESVKSYRFGDRDTHYTMITKDPGVRVYVSGTYTETEHGSHQLSSPKEYEYILATNDFPVSVGDTLTVPVNRRDPLSGRSVSTSRLQIQITDIYTKERFHPYHERTNG